MQVFALNPSGLVACKILYYEVTPLPLVSQAWALIRLYPFVGD